MSKLLRNCLSLFSFLAFTAFSQTVKFTPDSASVANVWHINDATSKKLFVGATFYYMDPSDPIVVSCESSESLDTGELYCMVPGFANSTIYLFKNTDFGSQVNVTDSLSKRGIQVPAHTEIFFMYKRDNILNHVRFTGRNRVGIDPENKITYPGASFVSRDFGARPGYGHRWAVAGRILNIVGTPTDTIIFGFEDGGRVIDPLKDSIVTADFDLNDVIFKVTGLDLNVEPFPDSLAIRIREPVHAGETVVCTTQVWADSAGIKISGSQFNHLVTWKLEVSPGDDIHHDSLINSYVNTNATATANFHPRTAYKHFVLCASLIRPMTGDTLIVRKPVFVLPGAPTQLSIELRADTVSSTFSLNHPVVITRIQIPSNIVSQSLHAIFRDKYGNFADFSKVTKWDTSYSTTPPLSSFVATVRNGDINKGQGIVEKTGSGNVYVRASGAYLADTLRDTVLVNVASATYDSLRIGIVESVGDTVLRSNIVMTTDSCKDLVAQGKRIDTRKWEAIPASWSSDRWTTALGTVAQSGIKFCPIDTGAGFIKVEYMGNMASLPFRVNPGVPVRLSLYTDKLLPFSQDTTASAGTPLILLTRLFDKNGIMLSNPASALVTWKLVEQAPGVAENSSGYLSDSVGLSTSFIPLRAQHVVRLFSRYGDLIDSIDIRIVPGKPFRVVIESSADWQKTINIPDEIDTIKIPDDRTDAIVYALVRDSIGNYIDSLRAGIWGSSDSIVYVNAGIKPCIGLIQKNLQVRSGICKIFVFDTISKFKDTAFVKLLPYHYIDLRIAAGGSVSPDSLIMSTNIDTVLYAQALRSDTAIWESVHADWSLTENLFINSVGPYNLPTFFVSPTRPGIGYITAKIASINSFSDTIFVRFTRGLPTHAELAIVTPPERLIAGDTIDAVVRIYNQDGLVPGAFCFNSDSVSGASVFQDTLRFNASHLDTRVFCGTISSVVNTFPTDTARIPLCFADGVVTVKFLSYYAPYSSDSLHRFNVKLGSLNASTPSFRLKPSILNSLTISHTHPCCPDTLVMRYPKDQVLLYTIGFDRFGNMRGGEPCNWHTTSTLHSFAAHDTLSRLIYGADSGIVKDDESGLAIAISSGNPAIYDSLFIRIIGPLSVPISAITRDINGNGLIDLIRIKFDMPVFPNSIMLDSRLNIRYNSVNFIVSNTKFSSDSLYMDVYLKETENQTLQTSWRPIVSLDNSQFLLGGASEDISIETSDGVGPVIATVRKDMSGDNRKNDLVTITFSEEIFGPDGNSFSLLELPARVFATWFQNPTGGFEQVKLLEGIKNFNTPNSPDRVFFSTSNGIELVSQNFFNLSTDPLAYVIKDRAGNVPSVDNRKVRVEIYGITDNNLVIAPNPSSPSSQREKPGEFHLQHNPYAYDWIRQDKGGTAITFQIILPEKNASVGGRIKIFDFVGNTVVADPVVDYKWMNLVKEGAVVSNETTWGILPSNWNSKGTVYNYTLYWNGYSDDGVRAAPGIYKVVFKLFTRSNGKDNVTLYKGFIGISR